jgi:hypothetical protein
MTAIEYHHIQTTQPTCFQAHSIPLSSIPMGSTRGTEDGKLNYMRLPTTSHGTECALGRPFGGLNSRGWLHRASVFMALDSGVSTNQRTNMASKHLHSYADPRLQLPHRLCHQFSLFSASFDETDVAHNEDGWASEDVRNPLQ